MSASVKMVIRTILLLSLISVALCDTSSFESLAYPDEFIRHRDWFGVISKIATDVDVKDATFKTVPGLADPDHEQSISFEAVNHPGYFLRWGQDSRIHLSKHEDHPQYQGHDDHHHSPFDTEATFYIETGNLNHEDRDTCSFRSFKDSNSFIRARNGKLFVEAGNNYIFHKESTFIPVDPQSLR